MTDVITQHAIEEATRFYPDLDLDSIREAADHTARYVLGFSRSAEAVVSPDDGTCYRIFVTHKPPVAGDKNWSMIQHPYLVAVLAPGTSAHEWSGNPVDWSYTREKWADADHTAKILSIFLGYLSAHL